MKYIYPAVFTCEEGKYLVSVPDLKGCHTFGNDLADAIEMARDAAAMWLCTAEDNGETIPNPREINQFNPQNGFASLIDVDTEEYRRINCSRAVKKTLSIPSWLNAKAEKAGINFSGVLQEALREKLNL
ncbi:MAG TPA: type II toxin-antitoxin system HicB family antitoxin [Oscillospiraceae bacterium]|jgi:predicted RNase H-like HicB family nuclease|nr:type II toxin-antitoxin system HicB family antitoxin [Oscillospiraceae bacterium]